MLITSKYFHIYYIGNLLPVLSHNDEISLFSPFLITKLIVEKNLLINRRNNLNRF